MLLMRVGRSPVCHSHLIRVLDKMGFEKPDRKLIIKKYFSSTINHYKLKKFVSDE